MGGCTTLCCKLLPLGNCNPALQVLGLVAVRATDALTRRACDIIAANVATANDFFAKWSDVFEWQQPQVGSSMLQLMAAHLPLQVGKHPQPPRHNTTPGLPGASILNAPLCPLMCPLPVMQAGLTAFPRLCTGEDVGEWCEALVEQAGVLLLPAGVVDHDSSAKRGHFRLGLGRTDFSKCLEHLDRWLHTRYRCGGQIGRSS